MPAYGSDSSITLFIRHVQPGDIGWHGSFGGRFDREVQKLYETLNVLKEKLNSQGQEVKWTKAEETRIILVNAGSHVWYSETPERELAAAFRHGGFTLDSDGHENEAAQVTLPSGRKIFPTYGGREVDPQRAFAQAGHGLVVLGQGKEIVTPAKSMLSLAKMPPLEPTVAPDYSQLILLPPRGGGKVDDIVFHTEKQKKQTFAAKAAADKRLEDLKYLFGLDETPQEQLSVAKKRKAEARTTDDNVRVAKAQRGAKASVEIDVEKVPFVRADFDALIKRELGVTAAVEVQRKPAGTASWEACLEVGKTIAFLFPDGWNVGTIKDYYPPPGRTKRGYNVNVLYPVKGGTVYHCLQLPLYGLGLGDGNTCPLGSWVLLRR